jgi:hypothetical protein
MGLFAGLWSGKHSVLIPTQGGARTKQAVGRRRLRAKQFFSGIFYRTSFDDFLFSF